MPALRELQAELAAALLRGEAGEIVGVILSDGLSADARVRVYANHVLTSLTEALEATYPVVCRLVDRRFFGFAADRFIRRYPPEAPCLFEYGAAFPEFLEVFPPCAGHPYLPDVARLEWAMNCALHAQSAPAIEPAALGAVDAERLGRLVLCTDPAAAWLRSSWPVDRIWRANQPDAEPGALVDLATGPVHLEVRRRDDRVTIRRLEPGDCAFRAALGAGRTLEAAADAATSEDSHFDLAEAIRATLAEELITGLALETEDQRAPS